MRNFIFRNAQNTFYKEYKTDKLDNQDNFTVHDISFSGEAGVEDSLTTLGLNYKREPHTLQEFIAKALALNLVLDELDFSDGTTTNRAAEGTALDITTSSLAAGNVGIAEVITPTFDSFANSAQGDYIIFNDHAGNSFAVWLDLDAAGTVPDGPLFLATTYQIEVDIVTGDTAIVVAGKVKAAVELIATWNASFETITDLGTGALTVTVTALGTVVDATVHDEPETGAGSISVVITTPGSGDYSVQLVTEGGNAPYTYALASGSPALVDGITLSSSGLVSGVATTTGTPAVEFEVTDNFGQTNIQILTLTIT